MELERLHINLLGMCVYTVHAAPCNMCNANELSHLYFSVGLRNPAQHTYTQCTCTERNLIENCHNTWSQRNDRQINAEKKKYAATHTELLSLMQLVINIFLCVPTIWYEWIKLQRSVFDSFIEFIARLFSLYPFMFTHVEQIQLNGIATEQMKNVCICWTAFNHENNLWRFAFIIYYWHLTR